MTRAPLIDAFLARSGWDTAVRHPLAGDASARRYIRLIAQDGAQAMLMDAPPETGEDTAPFVRVARHLARAGFSAPAILDWDEPAGLILMEDLGDGLVSAICAEDQGHEPMIYAATARMLAALHLEPVPEWADRYDPPRMAEMLGPFHEYAVPMNRGGISDMERAMEDTLRAHALADPVLILRDFHAENLLWLPERDGHARIGLLDFQDALAGDPTYDLASLFQDARRDVSAEASRAATEAFCDATGHSHDAVVAGVAVQGAQRNLRILGIFARLTRAGKPKYAPLVPRVEHHLAACLAHPACTDLRRALARAAPGYLAVHA
ncbi:aminoglycoside phosphotransferase family protein [Pseudaestuariivita atlantica]|uniref:Aminoglycoside phosphotransferase domain-containing protein n=1 Tax=Pseudaestuariivita atlantica TaxID=1317121 RepID=A0A0L1JQ77_9RHOB|nr:phosphotransferase [Pseudaestuariivita atlantica]KNG93900.1 hypothetical protein ATO11_10695 [Pseudaestuariivita atlantica]